MIYVVRYTDPVSKHLNAAEAAIAARLQADNDSRLAELAEARLQQRLMMAGDLVRIGREATVGAVGERLTLRIESGQTLPGNDGRPKLYIRYKVLNQTVAPLDDLALTVRVVSKSRKNVVGTQRSAREVFDVQDVRSSPSVPAGTAVAGLLILDAFDLERSESLSIEATAFNAQRTITLDRVLVGH
jgi:hypothetical protein